LANGKLADEHHVDGHDISDLIYGKADAKTPYEAFYYYQESQLQAIRSGPWKLFLKVDPIRKHPHLSPKETSRELLFHVVDDVGCEHDLANKHPEIVARLRALAEKKRLDLGDRDFVGDGQRPAGKIPDGAQPVPQLLRNNALNLIESERGGRHWADAKTAPPKEPAESLAAIQIEPGFEIQLYAAEPLVFDPVAMEFDHLGRMYVMEYGDYPIGPVEGGDPLSKIVVLEDQDQNGVADTRHVFADKLDFAHSLMPFDGGILVGAKTKVLFLKDTDGDFVADVHEVWFDGFEPAHPQMQIGNPRWGIDNWIYMNYGPGKVASKANPSQVVELGRKEFRFNPQTMAFESDSGVGQYGNTIDRWGRRFYGSNRNPIMTTFLTPSVIARNQFFVPARAHYDVGDAGGETRVFPLVQMNSNYLSHAGTHTAACGTTAYTGEFEHRALQSSVMVCEPIGHLVTRSIIQRKGLQLRAERAQESSDFIASTDTWFRPSSLTNGPDGALYLADMYRLWVEHPKFLPPEIAAKLDWRAGEDRGRIYRILPTGAKTRPFSPPVTNHDAVALLADASGWRQFLGHRLLMERKAKESAGQIRGLLRTAPQPTTRLHAIWILDGFSELRNEDLQVGLSDPDGNVQAAALQLATTRMRDSQIQQTVVSLADSNDIQVRLGVALALFENTHPETTQTLARLAMRDVEDPYFVDGLMTSVKERSGEVLKHLVTTQAYVQSGTPQRINLIKKLASTVGARGDLNELEALFELVAEAKVHDDWWVAASVSGLGQGLPRHQGDLGRVSLVGLLAKPPERLRRSSERLQQLLARTRDVATDSNRTLVDRLSAVELLAYQPINEVRDAIRILLSNEQPIQLQTASIEALSSSNSTDVASLILERWPLLSPTVRGMALKLLLRRTDSTRMALEQMEAGKIKPSSLSIDQRVLLLKHADHGIRGMADRLFGGAVSANRAEVAKDYEKSLTLTGSANEGEKVFAKTCANCHRFQGKGFAVGPDLTDMRNRPKPAILYDVLDPNSKVEPVFATYAVLTHAGTVYTGLVESETNESVVLKMAEGKKMTIGRAEIDTIKLNEVSLMPEGIEKDISIESMADLLEYLTSS
jgi:putative membrane-bound dehydrogenase-like protein